MLKLNISGWLTALRTTQAKFICALFLFFAVLMGMTVIMLDRFVAPHIQETELQLIRYKTEKVADAITEQMNRVQAQMRSLTQTTVVLDSQEIDRLLPMLIDQYQDLNLFGGGIWPLPGKRIAGRDKFSTFFARNDGNQLEMNTYWNSGEAPDYWEQTWYTAGLNSPSGHCVWASAYQDGASSQPRTNCAMVIIKDEEPWGVATIDVTLGFFNQLVQQMNELIQGNVLIIETNGKVVGNAEWVGKETSLENLNTLDIPSAPVIRELLSAHLAGQRPTYREYQLNGIPRTVILQVIKDSPWMMVIDLPTALLTQQTYQIIMKLGFVQIPMVLLLLSVLIGFIHLFMRRLSSLRENIDILASRGADLTQRLTLTGSSEFNAVHQSFNKVLAYLQKQLQQIRGNEQIVSAASQQISAGNRKLSEHAESQASAVQQIATFMEELSSACSQNTGNAAQTNTLVHEVSLITEQSSRVMKQTLDAMELVQRSSGDIVNIINTIESIAFQTNLLALNASVEAARAGSQGRGFTVVAQEVRNLAQRSAQASQEIRGVIGVSVNNINTSATLIQQVEMTMGKLRVNVHHVTELMGQVMTASHEQKSSIEQIQQAINLLEQTIQQNMALVQQTREASQSMAEQTQQLDDVVASFKL